MRWPGTLSAGNRDQWRAAVAIAIAAGLVRLLVASVTPLLPDEMYYWDWSRQLAAGYFDHPPLIAWTIALGTAVAGDTPLGVRLGPVLAGVVGTLFVIAAARRLAGDRAALVASVVFAVMPLSAAGLVLATPDAPLLAAVAASQYALVRALGHASGSGASFRWWCVSGATIGVALTAKYTGVLFPFGVFAALLALPALRPRLREPGPYVATILALAAFAPVIAWNADREWVSFAFQLGHGLRAAPGSAVGRELELIGGQMALVSPILFVLCAVAVARALRDRPRTERALLAVVAMVIFGFFMYSATKRRVEANWPALAYLPAVLLLAAYVPTVRWTKWLRAGVVLSALLATVIYVNTITPILPVPARRDPVARAAGWDHLARVVHPLRTTGSGGRTFVAANRYQEAAALAFHLPDHPRTFSLNIASRVNHYDLWPGFEETARAGDRLVLVVDAVEGTHPAVAALAPHFTRVTQGDMVTLARNGDPVKFLRVWSLDGWRGTWLPNGVRSRS